MKRDSCAVCGTFASLTWHHLYYTEDDVRYSAYPKTPKGRAAYQEAVGKLALSDPDRFVRLCSKHHFAVEKFARFNPITLNRIVKIARRTRKLQDEIANRQAQTSGTAETTETAGTAGTADTAGTDLDARRRELESDIAKIERKLEISKLERRVAVLT